MKHQTFFNACRRGRRRLLCIGIAIVGSLALTTAGQAQRAPNICEQAGASAEQSFGLPPGLLQAIGRVESGRWIAAERRYVTWPWSVDIDGAAHRYENAEDAMRDVRTQLATGGHSIDVGCFQINLGWHPNAFESLESAFDPVANANYAAMFLRSLNQRLGSWPAAVAAYHSANPDLGAPYRERVMAIWSSASIAEPVLQVQPAAEPAWVSAGERFGIHIWTPTNSARADSAAESVSGVGRPTLPRVITPAR